MTTRHSFVLYFPLIFASAPNIYFHQADRLHQRKMGNSNRPGSITRGVCAHIDRWKEHIGFCLIFEWKAHRLFGRVGARGAHQEPGALRVQWYAIFRADIIFFMPARLW